jgi:hypothetical protein
MRRYAITFESYRPNQEAAIRDCIRKLANEWEHPLANLWIIRTALSAGEIRTALLPHAGYRDRVYICETEGEHADFNAVSASGTKVTRIQDVRPRNRMLRGIFSRNGHGSLLLKAAISENLQLA